MIELTQLVSVFQHIISWLKLANDEKQKDREDYKKALLSVYLAANETKLYVATLKRRKKADIKRQAELSRLWTQAAVEIRELDAALAQKCLLRGDYWADPTEWTQEELESARISLKEIFERSRELL